jgi:hypothetical protein
MTEEALIARTYKFIISSPSLTVVMREGEQERIDQFITENAHLVVESLIQFDNLDITLGGMFNVRVIPEPETKSTKGLTISPQVTTIPNAAKYAIALEEIYASDGPFICDVLEEITIKGINEDGTVEVLECFGIRADDPDITSPVSAEKFLYRPSTLFRVAPE